MMCRLRRVKMLSLASISMRNGRNICRHLRQTLGACDPLRGVKDDNHILLSIEPAANDQSNVTMTLSRPIVCMDDMLDEMYGMLVSAPASRYIECIGFGHCYLTADAGM